MSELIAPVIISLVTPDGKIPLTGMPFPDGLAGVAEELETMNIPEPKADTPPAEPPVPFAATS